MAVFSRVPGATAGFTVAAAVYTTELRGGRSAVSLMSPVPEAVQMAPLVPMQVQLTSIRADGNASATVTPSTCANDGLAASWCR